MNKIYPKDVTFIRKILLNYGEDHEDFGLCYYTDKRASVFDNISTYQFIGSFVLKHLPGSFGYTSLRAEFASLICDYIDHGFEYGEWYNGVYRFKSTPEGVKIRRRMKYLATGK
jgi:hypothetical protein